MQQVVWERLQRVPMLLERAPFELALVSRLGVPTLVYWHSLR